MTFPSTKILALLLPFSLGLGALACGSQEYQPDCSAGQCDVGDVLAQRQDPIARYLRTVNMQQDELGELALMEEDYESILRGVAKIQGCGEDTFQTFVLSDDLFRGPGNGSDEVQARVDLFDPEDRELACDQEGGELIREGVGADGKDCTAARPCCIVTFPRIISTVCSGDKVSEFFISAPQESEFDFGEIDVQAIEMFAWDPETRNYNFYETRAFEDGLTELNPAPTRCQECHLTPSDSSPDGMHMTPIMNELKQPWTHWFSGGRGSHRFFAPPRATASNSYASVVLPFMSTAPKLQQIIEDGHRRVAAARLDGVLERGAEPSPDRELWQEAMNTLRPLFCAEQINYVTLMGNSVQLEAVLDPSIGRRLEDMGITGNNFQAQSFIEFPESATVEQIPVRGNADIQLENDMVSFEYEYLTDEQALRIHALGWQDPVFSEVRCSIWRDAYNYYSGNPPEFDFSEAEGDTELHMMIATQTIVKRILAKLPQVGEDKLVVVSSFDHPETQGDPSNPNNPENPSVFSEAVDWEEATCGPTGRGFCALSFEDFGRLVQAYVTDVRDNGLPALRDTRNKRVCEVVEPTPLEVLPTQDREILPLSNRFDGGMEHCFAHCCGTMSLDKGANDAFPSDREICESKVQQAIVNNALFGETINECVAECMPARFSNRPGIPAVPETCALPGQLKRGLPPLCGGADLLAIERCGQHRTKNKQTRCFNALVNDDALAPTCTACAVSAKKKVNDLEHVVRTCNTPQLLEE